MAVFDACLNDRAVFGSVFQGNPCISKATDVLSGACLSVSQNRVLLLLIDKAELKS